MVINGGNVDASRYLLEQTIKSAYRRASFFTSWLCSWRRSSSTRLWNPADMAYGQRRLPDLLRNCAGLGGTYPGVDFVRSISRMRPAASQCPPHFFTSCARAEPSGVDDMVIAEPQHADVGRHADVQASLFAVAAHLVFLRGHDDERTPERSEQPQQRGVVGRVRDFPHVGGEARISVDGIHGIACNLKRILRSKCRSTAAFTAPTTRGAANALPFSSGVNHKSV